MLKKKKMLTHPQCDACCFELIIYFCLIHIGGDCLDVFVYFDIFPKNALRHAFTVNKMNSGPCVPCVKSSYFENKLYKYHHYQTIKKECMHI